MRTLAVSTYVEASLNADIGQIVDKCWSGDANLGVIKRYLLGNIDMGAMESKLGLVYPARVEKIGVGQRKISELIGLLLRRAGHGVAQKVRPWQRDCLLAVGEKETRINLAFLGL